MSLEECTETTQLAFRYRGVYVHHIGQDEVVAEANQEIFFNTHEGYRVSHPVAGGDGSLTLVIEESRLHELAPLDLLRRSPRIAFRHRRLPIDSRAQALVALLRHSLHHEVAEPLQAEGLALTLVRLTLGPRPSRLPGTSAGRQKLADRAKVVLASDLMRRWTLADVASELRVSPVYLTQVFQQV